MNKKRPAEPIRRQRTVFYNSRESSEPSLEFYKHMFREDIALTIMPIGGRSSRPDFKVLISPSDSRAEQIIIAGLNGRYFGDTLSHALYDYFRKVAANLCLADRLVFEIVYFEDRETKKLIGFELDLVNSTQIIEKENQIYQFVTPEVAAEKNIPSLIPLPREDLIFFTPPSGYGKALRDVRMGISQLDRMRLPSFAIEAREKNISYDFNVVKRSMNLALVEVTKPIGWNARGSFNDQVLSYYWIRMNLTFERFKIQLRNSILTTLNDGLRRIGQKLEFSSQIEIAGLPTLADVDTAVRNLDSGAMAFTEVMKPFKM